VSGSASTVVRRPFTMSVSFAIPGPLTAAVYNKPVAIHIAPQPEGSYHSVRSR